MLVIAALCAIVTCFIVPPDSEYTGYFDLKTLSCLFMTLAAVCALRDIRFFTVAARKIVNLAGNLRLLALLLIYMTFIGSMLIANDMALITFLPVGYYALSVSDNEEHSAYIFILQNISANLGGMLTPFGNPQNLYLYTYYGIPTGEFTTIMLPPFILAVAILTVLCLVLPGKGLVLTEKYDYKVPVPRAVFYVVLFLISILSVFRLVPWQISCVLVIVSLLFSDRTALKSVDYPLLLTFAFFFVFSGNMSRIVPVKELLERLLSHDVLIPSIVSCQFISNVPTALLLSRFTDNYRELLLGVNIGGTGTLISSLASLITFSEYCTLYPTKKKHYLLLFALLNLLFLVVLGGFGIFLTTFAH